MSQSRVRITKFMQIAANLSVISLAAMGVVLSSGQSVRADDTPIGALVIDPPSGSVDVTTSGTHTVAAHNIVTSTFPAASTSNPVWGVHWLFFNSNNAPQMTATLSGSGNVSGQVSNTNWATASASCYGKADSTHPASGSTSSKPSFSTAVAISSDHTIPAGQTENWTITVGLSASLGYTGPNTAIGPHELPRTVTGQAEAKVVSAFTFTVQPTQ